jgi:hypothetical protein
MGEYLMVDMFVLAMLSRGMTILEKTYYVVWNADKHVAQILWCPSEPKPEGPCDFLRGEEEEPLVFDCELDAHAYLNNLDSLDQTRNPNAWRIIPDEK